MQAAFHITTKVLPGNKIEIQLPEGAIAQGLTGTETGLKRLETIES